MKNVIDILAENASALVMSLVVALVAWRTRSVTVQHRLAASGLCASCGRNPAVSWVNDLTRSLALCEACAGRVRRSQVAGYRFFLVMGVVGLTLTAFGTFSDLRHGYSIPKQVLLYLPLAFSPLIFAWLIRKQTMRKE